MENDAKLVLKIILGSVREGRFSEKVAPWVVGEAKKHSEFEAETLDLREYELPFFNEAQTPSSKKQPYTNPVVARWTQKIAEADVFLIIAPEYDRGAPGVLKNAIDWVYPEWNKKAVGFVAYGTTGGARSVEQLRQNAIELQLAPIRDAVHITAPWALLDEAGNIKPGAFDQYERSADTMLKQLAWWGKVLKRGRAEL